MSFLLKVKKRKLDLIASARYSMLISMLRAWDNCRARGEEPDEPDIVASLVLNGTKLLEKQWRKIFKPLKIKIALTGIYCHQTPRINFKGMNKKYCELGDLLWCHIHSDNKGNISRNAILYQAKKSSNQPYKIHNNELDQYKLYSEWPEFTYVRSGKLLNGKKRKVKPSAPRRGAQYLLIDDRPPEQPESGMLGLLGTYPISSCIPSNPLIDHSDVGMELFHSLEGLSGDAFDDRGTAQKEEGWSRVIWDLLESSVKKAFRRSKSGVIDQPRSTGAKPNEIDGCFYSSSSEYPPSRKTIIKELIDGRLTNNDTPPPTQNDEWHDEGGGAVSTVLLETYETQE